jgi:hypothetical protein
MDCGIPFLWETDPNIIIGPDFTWGGLYQWYQWWNFTGSTLIYMDSLKYLRKQMRLEFFIIAHFLTLDQPLEGANIGVYIRKRLTY